MINPGTRPLDDTTEDLAAANLAALIADAGLATDPVRDPGLDRDGRYGWQLPLADGTSVLVLVPGVELTALRDDVTAQAPCLYLNGGAWWWNDAVGLLRADARWGTQAVV